MNFDHYTAAPSGVKFSRCFQSCRSFTSRYRTEIMWTNRNNQYFVFVGFVTKLMIHSTTRRNQDFGESQLPRFHSRERGQRKRAEQPRHYLCNRIIHNAYGLLISREVLIPQHYFDKRPKTCAPRRLWRVVSMKERGASGQLWGHLKLPT